MAETVVDVLVRIAAEDVPASLGGARPKTNWGWFWG